MPNLKIVYIDSDVHTACLKHALSNEREEVMGLLIGEIVDGECRISAYESLRRLDKRKDRVEISPEQLTEATEKAEAVAQELNRPLRIVGWYHSHPHITVFPSHVDLNTQSNYQQLDEGFVGMIISVFSEGKTTKDEEIVVCCFQTDTYSLQQSPKYIKLRVLPSKVKKPCLEAMVRLPHTILLEEDELFHRTVLNVNSSPLTQVQNQAERIKAMASVFERVSLPLLMNLRCKLLSNACKLTSIEKETLRLQKEMRRLSGKISV